jgi:hypothetical protein
MQTLVAMEVGNSLLPNYACESELALRRRPTNRNAHDDKRICADHTLDSPFVLSHGGDDFDFV